MPKGKTARVVKVCTPVFLPEPLLEQAARFAIAVNPANAPPPNEVTSKEPGFLAMVTGKYWGASGVDLTVGFMETTAADLRTRILAHLNAASEFCNIIWRWSQISPEVRISRGPGGYYSYLGTDILSIPQTAQTMNLEGFTMRTPESEFFRVVRHEGFHSCGFMHEHQREEIIARLLVKETLAYYKQHANWDEATVRQQVLTPVSEKSLMGTLRADPESIMAYPFPAELMKDGVAVPGGKDFTAIDKAFAALMYPLASRPTPPPGRTVRVTVDVDVTSLKGTVISVT